MLSETKEKEKVFKLNERSKSDLVDHELLRRLFQSPFSDLFTALARYATSLGRQLVAKLSLLL